MEGNHISKEFRDRTNRFARTFLGKPKAQDISEEFSKFSVGITGDHDILETYSGQTIIVTLVNLMARFHPSVIVNGLQGISTKVWLPFGYHTSLNEAVLNIGAKLSSTVVLKPVDDVDILVSVGPTDNRASYKIYVNADGWNAYFSNNVLLVGFLSQNQNPIGGLLASCFGAADVFRKLLELLGSRDRRILRQPKSFVFSAFDYSTNNKAPNPALPNKVNVGELTIVGGGAVANSLLYTIGMISGVEGSVNVVDYDSYDSTNMNRCLAVCKEHIGIPKAQALSSLPYTFLHVKPFIGKYADFPECRRALDMVVSTVDNNDARLQIQCDLPRILFHGATGENVCTIFKCDFLEGACLGCLFFEERESRSLTIARQTGLTLEEVENLLGNNLPLTQAQIERIVSKTGVKRLQNFVGITLEELYTQEICDVMQLDVEEQEIAGTVSFVSAIPGILLAGEIIKARIPEFRKFSINNYLTMNAFYPIARWLLKREKDIRCRCFCSDPAMRDSFRKKWQL